MAWIERNKKDTGRRQEKVIINDARMQAGIKNEQMKAELQSDADS